MLTSFPVAGSPAGCGPPAVQPDSRCRTSDVDQNCSLPPKPDRTLQVRVPASPDPPEPRSAEPVHDGARRLRAADTKLPECLGLNFYFDDFLWSYFESVKLRSRVSRAVARSWGSFQLPQRLRSELRWKNLLILAALANGTLSAEVVPECRRANS